MLNTLKELSVRLNELQKEYEDVIAKVGEVWKTIYPQLRDSYDKIANALIRVLDAVANIALIYFKALLSVINEHQKELKEIAVAISEIAQDIAKIIYKGATQIRKDVDEFVVLLIQQFKALPIYEYLKEQYQDFKIPEIPESILISIQDLSEVVKAGLPTEELRQFYNAVYEYIIKLVKHKQVSQFSVNFTFPVFDSNGRITKVYALGSPRLTMPPRSKRSTHMRSMLPHPSSSLWSPAALWTT